MYAEVDVRGEFLWRSVGCWERVLVKYFPQTERVIARGNGGVSCVEVLVSLVPEWQLCGNNPREFWKVPAGFCPLGVQPELRNGDVAGPRSRRTSQWNVISLRIP